MARPLKFFDFQHRTINSAQIAGMPILIEKVNPMHNDLTNQIEQTSNQAILEALTDAGKQKFEDGKAPNLEDIDLERLDEWQKVIQEAGCSFHETGFRQLCR